MASLSEEESDFESRQRMAKVLLKIIVASFLVAAVIFYLTWRQSSAARESSPATGDRTPTRWRKPRPPMDPGLRSPLVDLFRRGEAGRDVRMLAAQGILAPRAHEQLALLVLLSDDEDQEIAQLASDTIGELPVETLRGFLARADVPAEIRNFFGALGVDPADDAVDRCRRAVDRDAVAGRQEAEMMKAPHRNKDDPKVLSSLPIVERMKIAMKGSREQRSQLVRDSNRMVATAVLSSPKLTDAEVETFTKMGNVSEDVLRIIGTNRSWLKNYGVVLGLVKNPKTPPAISMQLLQRLSEKDIKMLAVDRNVPEALRMVAQKADGQSAEVARSFAPRSSLDQLPPIPALLPLLPHLGKPLHVDGRALRDLRAAESTSTGQSRGRSRARSFRPSS